MSWSSKTNHWSPLLAKPRRPTRTSKNWMMISEKKKANYTTWCEPIMYAKLFNKNKLSSHLPTLREVCKSLILLLVVSSSKNCKKCGKILIMIKRISSRNWGPTLMALTCLRSKFLPLKFLVVSLKVSTVFQSQTHKTLWKMPLMFHLNTKMVSITTQCSGKVTSKMK